MRMIPTILSIFDLVGFASASEAAIGKRVGVPIQKLIYLGDAEAEALKDELARQRFNDETFTLVMKCDKYKRSPDAKNRTLNCFPVSAMSEPEDPNPKYKTKR